MQDGYSGPATIVQGGASYDVTITYTVSRDPRSGLIEWSGSLGLDPATALDVAAAELRLPDGSTGAIIVSHLGSGYGRFVGNGDPPS